MRRITVALVLVFVFGAGVLAGFTDSKASNRPICWLTACTKGKLLSCCRDEYGLVTCVAFTCLPNDFFVFQNR